MTGYELTGNPFTVNSANITGDYGSPVTVNVTNNYSKDVSELNVFVLLYNAEGQIIGGGNDSTKEPIPSGDSIDFELLINYSYNEVVDSIETWVEPSNWTEFE